MESIILQILEKYAKIFMKEGYFGAEEDGNKSLGELAKWTQLECNNLATEILQVYLESLNLTLRESKKQRLEKGWRIKEKNCPRTIMTSVGSISFKRDRYLDDSGKSFYLLDEMMQIGKNDRVDDYVKADLVSAATKESYSKASEHVVSGNVSRQTVKNSILELGDMSAFEDIPKEKRQAKEIHIYADEDHAHMQKPGKKKGKKSRIVPLVVVTEGTESIGTSRRKTVNPHYFVNKKFDTERLWEDVYSYVYTHYELTGNEKIYVHGDGAAWINRWQEYFPDAEFVLDGFHLFKAIRKLSNRFPKQSVRIRLCHALEENNLQKAKEILSSLYELCEKESDIDLIRTISTYLLGNWNGAVKRVLIGSNGGSCTEAQISHVLSERISRNPLGWSEEGLGILSTQRMYILNGGRISGRSFETHKERALRDKEIRKEIFKRTGEKLDWSIFEEEKVIFDGSSATRHLIDSMGCIKDVFAI